MKYADSKEVVKTVESVVDGIAWTDDGSTFRISDGWYAADEGFFSWPKMISIVEHERLPEIPDHPRIGIDKNGPWVKGVNFECTWSHKSDRFIIAFVMSSIWQSRSQKCGSSSAVEQAEAWIEIGRKYASLV